ncbi:MAG: hypothetical protein QOE80_127 [Actinomycetota bacterium]|jgi:hypothetical protein|nr:hypothetical protein [Actinomycetota bacterium]
MSRLHRFLCIGAVGLFAAAVPITAASAATPAPGPGGPGSPIGVTTPIGSIALDPGGDLSCMPFEYSLGPFGPLGPWGPYGPLHDKDHPACFGGGPKFK